jgi:hypothetical protein
MSRFEPEATPENSFYEGGECHAFLPARSRSARGGCVAATMSKKIEPAKKEVHGNPKNTDEKKKAL